MNTATLAIPPNHVTAVTESLLMLYASTAEATFKTIQHDDLEEVRLDICAHRWRLRHLGRLIDQLQRSASASTIELTVAGEHWLLTEALHGVLCDAADALSDACQQFLNGGDPDELREHHVAVADVLAVIATLGPPPKLVPVAVAVDHDITELVQLAVARTGYTPEHITTAAVASWIDVAHTRSAER
jgi:hypothetical protein